MGQPVPLNASTDSDQTHSPVDIPLQHTYQPHLETPHSTTTVAPLIPLANFRILSGVDGIYTANTSGK